MFIYLALEANGKDYRGPTAALTFEELYSGADNAREAKCCKMVSNVSNAPARILTSSG